jgi:hypothetical protein
MGLQAYYYDNLTEDNFYNGEPPIPPTTPMVASIPVATVDQDYDLYPIAGLIDDFVVKYESYLTATESATVNLQCLADDGCIVIINGVTIINEWWDKGTDGGIYQYTLVPNVSLPFVVWYYENGGGAVVQLRWQFPNGDWNIVPEAVFSTVPKEIAPPIVDTSTVVDTSTATQETVTVIVEPIPVPPAPQPEPPVAIPDPAPVVMPDAPPAVEPEPPVVEPVPPVAEPEPPVVEPEPPTPIEEPPVVVEEPPVVAEEPPAVIEEPPAPVEEPPLVANENSTDAEKEIIATALIEAAAGNPVTAEAIAAAGLTYADLPPQTPVEVRQDENGNQVVITAEVAQALTVLENPAALVTAIFTDPAQALLALGSIGADMSPQERAESEKTIVAAVIVGGIATQSALTAAASAGTVAYRRKP